MNESQRKQIWTMRSQGMGYGTIAQTVHLPKDAVRKFCSRRPELKGYGHVVQQMIEGKISDQPKCLECLNNFELNHK